MQSIGSHPGSHWRLPRLNSHCGAVRAAMLQIPLFVLAVVSLLAGGCSFSTTTTRTVTLNSEWRDSGDPVRHTNLGGAWRTADGSYGAVQVDVSLMQDQTAWVQVQKQQVESVETLTPDSGDTTAYVLLDCLLFRWLVQPVMLIAMPVVAIENDDPTYLYAFMPFDFFGRIFGHGLSHSNRDIAGTTPDGMKDNYAYNFLDFFGWFLPGYPTFIREVDIEEVPTEGPHPEPRWVVDDGAISSPGGRSFAVAAAASTSASSRTPAGRTRSIEKEKLPAATIAADYEVRLPDGRAVPITVAQDGTARAVLSDYLSDKVAADRMELQVVRKSTGKAVASASYKGSDFNRPASLASTRPSTIAVAPPPTTPQPATAGAPPAPAVPIPANLTGSLQAPRIPSAVGRLSAADSGKVLSENRWRALLIGITGYKNVGYNLGTPVNDVTRLAQVLSRDYGFEVEALPDDRASRRGIRQALQRYAESVGPQDNVLILFSGHGYMKNDVGYWLPWDADDSDDGFANAEVKDIIDSMRARRVLLISDSCYAGSFLTRESPAGGGAPQPTSDPGISSRVSQLVAGNHRQSREVIAAGNIEPVRDRGTGMCRDHSPFACAIISALEAVPRGGVLTANDLYVDVYSQVRTGRSYTQRPQRSTMQDHAGGEYFFLRR